MKSLILLMPIAALLAACSKETPPVAKVERPVLTQVVGAVASDAGNTYSGEVRARNETPLGFRVGGKIVERLVDAGTVVKSGQILARIDANDAGLQAGAADAQLQLAQAETQRYRELRSKGFISQSALDAKETALKAAAAQAGLAKNQSAYTTLRADRAGVVAATLAEVGQVVSAGQAVVRVAQDGAREVAIAIPEAQFAQLKVGATADISLWANGGEATHFAGRVRELAPVADVASRTYAARVSFDDAKAQVALGMTAQVRFSQADKNGGLLVPLTAIFQQGENAAVWVVAADHSVKLRAVQVAAYRDNAAIIASGVAAGERIVSAGVHKLTAGEKVLPIEAKVESGVTK